MRPELRGMKRTLILIVAAVVGLTACGSTGQAGNTSTAPTGPVVGLKSLMFMPPTLTIKVGQTVTWRNDEPITHTVTSGSVTGIDPKTGLRSGQKPDSLFDAKLPKKGSTFSFTFRKAGTYSYYCDIHQGMNATIVVS